jgi:hypothetical protein
MAVNVNLSRNTKVYYTSNIAADSGYTNYNTFEIQVMDGYQFSQGTEQQVIQINEAGQTPNRGQRAFNTQLNPVEWSFGAYLRPLKVAAGASLGLAEVSGTAGVAYATTSAAHSLSDGDVVAVSGLTPSGFNRTSPVEVTGTDTFKYSVAATATGTATGTGSAIKSERVTCVERLLWNALAGKYDLYDPTNSSPAWAEATGSASLNFSQSQAHTLAPFALIFKVDNTYYKINNCAVNQAEIQFGLDQIAMVNWSGFGTTVAEISDTQGLADLATVAPADVSANFITNKLTTVTLNSNISGDGSTGGSVSYSLPITGGSLTIVNNLTYLTPEILGIVNSSIGYFTGTRGMNGNVTAYLRTGTGGTHTGTLLNDILASVDTSPETKFNMTIEVGGKSNATRVELQMPAVQIQVPTIDIQDVVSTTINFTAQGYLGTNYDITAVNELEVRYFSAV